MRIPVTCAFNFIAHRHGDELYDRKRPQEVNPLLTHNASLTLRMCAHGRRQLPAFDFLAHLLLGLDNHVTQKLVDSQKAINEPKSSELTVYITIVHLVTGHLHSYCFCFSSFTLK